MIKKITLIVLLTTCLQSFGQIINEAPYILTITELKAWEENGSTADPALISTVPLAERFINTETQFNPSLSNDLEIAYLPDGMNNFGNYSGEQSQFNLYNFTNWSYIDKLVWFGGTADQTIQLPSAPWANAAHKNGVKIFGDVFFAPNVFGGSTATLLSFLEQDGSNNFIVIPKMIAIMEYYKFDGWFINQETSTDANTAELMYQFVRDLTTATEALGKEVMWYDAMLLNGSVGWQNRLNANNSVFVQRDEDGDSGNGFEQRVSSSIFINFFWNTSAFPSSSRDRANVIGRSSFEVFTGVDVWPGRNQAPFQTGGNNWMTLLHENQSTPFTSLGLFAPNCVYNSSVYSNFNNDPNDYENFYSAERHMFSGADRNPQLEDATGFKGYANWVPAASAITEIPFETNFNTGHGLKKFTEGVETSANPWHNMDSQDVLPTWQFAFSENNVLNARWDFEDAYNGGSSLKVEGDLPANQPVDLSLYKTKLPITEDSKVDIVFKYNLAENTRMKVFLIFADSPSEKVEFSVSPGATGDWFGRTFSLSAYAGRELAVVGLRFVSTDAVNSYSMNIGNMKVHEGPGLGISENFIPENQVVIFYPINQPSKLNVNINWLNGNQLQYAIYGMDGKRISTNKIDGNHLEIDTAAFSKGIYLFKVLDDEGYSITKKIVIRQF